MVNSGFHRLYKPTTMGISMEYLVNLGWVQTNPFVFWYQWDYLLTNQLRTFFFRVSKISHGNIYGNIYGNSYLIMVFL